MPIHFAPNGKTSDRNRGMLEMIKRCDKCGFTTDRIKFLKQHKKIYGHLSESRV